MTSSRRTRPVALTLPAPGPLTGHGSRDIATGPWGSHWISRMQSPVTTPHYAYDHDYAYDYGDGRDGRLSRARTLARRGAVGDLTVRPGMISAKVRGSRPTPYRCEIHVPELSAADWDRLVDEWAADAERVIAELAGDRLGPHCRDAASRAGADLVPAPGGFTYHCSCPDWGDPCKHAAALGYVYARCLDDRGEALLVLHGRNLADVCAAVTARCDEATRAEQARADDEARADAEAARSRGVPASAAFARESARGAQAELPPLPAPAPHHGEPAALPEEPETGAVDEPVDPAVLRMLSRDAARRAADTYRHLCSDPAAPENTDGTRPGPATRPDTLLWLDADVWHDTVRRAAHDAEAEPYLLERLVNSSHQARGQLARASAAWRYGGPPALSTLDAAHPPDQDSERTAREQLAQVRIRGRSAPPLLQRTRGRLRLVGEDVELRWGTDARWYPYTRHRGQWQPAGPPAPDATEALRGAVTLEQGQR